MSFLWPQALALLLALPALVGIYLWFLRRRSRSAVAYTSIGLVRSALTRRSRVRRHVPPLLLLAALAALIVAGARPQATVTLPSEQRTIILAIDVSRSMSATDIEPSRIAAAREAAKGFVQEQPDDVRIGIVAFAGSASIVQRPTRERTDLLTAIDQLQLQIHTAIGSGIIVSLAAMFPGEGLEAFDRPFGRLPEREGPRGTLESTKKAQRKEFTPVAPGSYRHGAIILLTDGRRTIGPDSQEAAKLAAERGVRIYTVGFGRADGGMADVDGYSIYMRFDEETLKAIAQITGAEYFRAGTAAELKKVYGELNTRYVLERQPTEVSALFAAVAALFTTMAGALSMLWFGRLA